MVKLCIFDMDGLLIDSERYMWNVSMDIAARQQNRIMDDEFHNSLMGLSRQNSAKKIMEYYGPDFDIKKFYETIEIENNKIMAKGVPLMQGAMELLNYLKQTGIKTCIGTSTNRKNAFNLLKADNLLEYFDEIVCGDEVVNGKPDPEIYIKCFNKFNFKKEEALIFEDADSGAKAAFEAGIRLVLVPDLAYLSQDSKDRAFKVIKDLSATIDIIKEENETTLSI